MIDISLKLSLKRSWSLRPLGHLVTRVIIIIVHGLRIERDREKSRHSPQSCKLSQLSPPCGPLQHPSQCTVTFSNPPLLANSKDPSGRPRILTLDFPNSTSRRLISRRGRRVPIADLNSLFPTSALDESLSNLPTEDCFSS